MSTVAEQAEAAPTIDVPVVADNKPDKPKMGDLISLSKDDWSAWTGGKPSYGWMTLDRSAADELLSPNQLRPVHASSSQKGYNFRRTGMTTQFTPASSLIDFQNAIWDHFTDCGMDTIAYLTDPEDSIAMTNIIKCHSRYTIQTAKSLSASQLLRYDKYDKNNDRAAIKYLLSSLTPTLMSKIKEKVEDTDSFHIVWLQLIKTIQSTSIERFEDLKVAIKTRHPSNYSGENLEALAADFRKDARELVTAGQYDHNLTLTMIKTFLLAGGAGNEDFRFPLRATKQKLDQALLDIGYKEKSGAQAHMVAAKLTYQDICTQAEDVYRTQYDRKEWPPAVHAPDTRAPRATYGNVATPESVPITRADVLNLIQSSVAGNHDKKGNCHKCGKAGHWANKCPDTTPSDRHKTNERPGSGGNRGGNGFRGTRTNKHQSWRTVPPPPGTGNAKKVKDKTFNWCDKCKRWTPSHTTATHTGERRNNSSPRANFTSTLSHDPSVWMFDFPTTTSFFPTLNDLCFLILNLNAIVLLAVSVLICTVVPLTVDLAIYLSKAIPWSTVIAWISNSLHQAIEFNPSLAFAPILWLILVTFPLWFRPAAPTPTELPEFTRQQRRQFNKVLKPYMTKPTTSSIRTRNLHPSYPLRLRNQGHFIPRQAPTANHRQSLKDLNTLKHRAITLQRRTQRLRTVKPFSTPPSGTSQKGERILQRNREYTKQCQCDTKYCPVPAVASPNAFLPSEWTLQQMQAARKIALHVNIARTSTLTMALQAPARMRNSLGPTVTSCPVIWDSGASISITPDTNDFDGTLQRPGTITQLKGIARGLQIKGQGEVTWAFHDVNGNLRELKIPAFYVPGIKVRLLSTTSLLQTYPDETITVESHCLTLNGIPGDPNRASIQVLVNEQNNLPTSDVYNSKDSLQAAEALTAMITEVHSENLNLNPAEKELLRWHFRLGHIGFKKVQFLIRTGVLSNTETSRKLHMSVCKLQNYPKCAACLYGKQHRRTIPGKTASSVVKDRENVLKANNLLPGQRISVDHFICHTRGRLLDSAGKTKEDDMYRGGCLFVDHASGFIFVEHQVTINTHSTLKAKKNFEDTCRSYGVIPQEYLSDNSTAFTSEEFSENLAIHKQILKFAGAGAHHHNGIAERNIRTIMAIARTMMLHSAIYWPTVADTTLWPLAVMHAVYLVNHVPDPRSGLSPADVFTKTRWEQRKLLDLHVWGCPTYVLDRRTAGGNKIPRWTARSVRSVNLGFSPAHATTVPIVLNPETGYITAQFNVVFDDWFATVAASIEDFPDFNSDAWAKMFGDSLHQYILDDDDLERLIVEEEDEMQHARQQGERIANAFDQAAPPQPLPVDPPREMSPRHQPTPNRVATPTTPNLPPESPPITQTREEPSPLMTPYASPAPPAPTPQQTPPRQPTPAAPTPVKLFQAPPTPLKPPTPLPVRQEETKVLVPVEQGSKNDAQDLPLRRSNRSRAAPTRLGYDGRQGRGYFAAAPLAPDWLFEEAAGCQACSTVAYKASSSDPDTLSFEEAMNDKENLVEWQKASNAEIVSLEKNGTWKEVPISQAVTRILPGTWVFRRKRTPDGAVSKYKARYCVRGDLQETEVETFAPVVAWSTVRLFLVLSLTLEWETCTIDFSSAFVQAPITEPVWIHLPRGYRSEKGNSTCLQLLKSLYGLSVAPRLWYEHLSDALRDEGFKTCVNDPCLLYKDTILVVLYVDDLGIAYSSKTDLDKLFGNLEVRGLNFTKEGSFTDFLGIKFKKDDVKGTLTLTQKGLIQKIKDATGMSESNYNWTPASQVALGTDPDGPAMNETWSYRSIVGMLLYLSTNTRPDISFAVSQVARFCHNPKRSHASAIKTIVRYLHRTCDMGMIVKPTGDLSVDCYVDADFAGLHGRDPDRSPSSAKSRTGYIITLGGCPILWKSHLQTEISLSTLEAEYSALSSSMRTLLPLRSMLIEIIEGIKLPHIFQSTVKCQVFEDNNGALLLATKQRITNRTKYFQVKWHFFWSHVRDGTIQIVKVDTQEQWADFLTKGLSRESFERVRKLVQGW